jgi:hypothetical protein
MLMMPMVVSQGCATQGSLATVDDPTTGLTLSGSSIALDAFLRSAEGQRHAWVVEKRWSKDDESQSVRLRWPQRPSPLDVGSIVWLAQAAQAYGLVISDTKIVETQP